MRFEYDNVCLMLLVLHGEIVFCLPAILHFGIAAILSIYLAFNKDLDQKSKRATKGVILFCSILGLVTFLFALYMFRLDLLPPR
jgi:hypothetical protein